MTDLTPAKIVEINELAEAEAHANYFLCAPPEFAQPFRLDAKRIGSVLVITIPEVDNVNYNRILGLGMGEPATEAMLDEAIAVFQNTGSQNYMTTVSSLAQPAQLPEWLATRGFKPGRNWAKMYRGTEPAPVVSTDLRLEIIGKDQADAYADVVLSVFGITPAYRPLIKGNVGEPGWLHCLAFAGEKPVAAASMFINGEVAWLGFATTLKTHRRRGGQSAMLARAIEEGLALGCKWFAAETNEDTPEHPNPSYHNMLRNGFKLAYLQRSYYHQPPESAAKRVRRALFVAAYSLRFEWQRFMQQGKTG
jgi:GNAT superfamily N-acetyltransferase